MGLPVVYYFSMRTKNAGVIFWVIPVAGLLAACGPEDVPRAGPSAIPDVPPAEGPAVAEVPEDVVVEENGATWMTDFHGALAEARDSGRPVLINLTGSDWCPPCRMLKERVFDSEEFNAYASRNLVLLEVDFPRRKELSPAQQEHNQAVAQLYRAEAFPTIIIAGADAAEKKRMVGAEILSPSEFISWVEN